MKFSMIISLMVMNLLFTSHAMAATRATYETDAIKVRVATNAPQPISAFYEGRGFQKNMIDILKQQCFVSVFIRNKSNDFIWLDLTHWEFKDADGRIVRLDRNYWQARWQKLGIPMAHQSTFRWTLLPETLDFHPKEKEGGNIILPRTGKPFSVIARFDTRKDRKGKPIIMNINNLTCKNDQ